MVNNESLFRQLKHSQTLPTKIHPFIFNIIIQSSKRRLFKWTDFDLNIFFIYLSRKNKTVILGQTSMLLGKFSKEHFEKRICSPAPQLQRLTLVIRWICRCFKKLLLYIHLRQRFSHFVEELQYMLIRFAPNGGVKGSSSNSINQEF